VKINKCLWKAYRRTLRARVLASSYIMLRYYDEDNVVQAILRDERLFFSLVVF